MIYTITFTPSIDYIVRMDKLEFGTVCDSATASLPVLATKKKNNRNVGDYLKHR